MPAETGATPNVPPAAEPLWQLVSTLATCPCKTPSGRQLRKDSNTTPFSFRPIARRLGYRHLQFAERFFEVREVRHWHLLSIAGVKAPRLLPIFNWLDRRVLQLPGLKLMSWMFSFELHKRVG